MDLHPLIPGLLVGAVVVGLLRIITTRRARRNAVELEAIDSRLARALGSAPTLREASVPVQRTTTEAWLAAESSRAVAAPARPGKPPRSAGGPRVKARWWMLVSLIVAANAWPLLAPLVVSREQDERSDAASSMVRSWVDERLVDSAGFQLRRFRQVEPFGGSISDAFWIIEVEALVRPGTVDDPARRNAIHERLSTDVQTLAEADLVDVTLTEHFLLGYVKKCSRRQFEYVGREDRASGALAVSSVPVPGQCP
jgi:hypothetical protein